MYDGDGLNAFIKSYSMSNNKIETKVKVVDDNLYYYNQLIEKANSYVLYPLANMGIIKKHIKQDTVLTFASFHKLMNGSPHEYHSYLLDNNVKAIGVKLFVPPTNTRVKSVVEDMAK